MAKKLIKVALESQGPLGTALMIGYFEDGSAKVMMIGDQDSAPLPANGEMGVFDSETEVLETYSGFKGRVSISYDFPQRVSQKYHDPEREADAVQDDCRSPPAIVTDPYGKANRYPGVKDKSKYARKKGKRKRRAHSL